ncbi:MAG: PQQ-binding-like beta-propeller repeat protein [Planctomycetes bacterium]|nr:PQQ-binding-like beta-propeller repeat protein [Planctomycetota bacterium]
MPRSKLRVVFGGFLIALFTALLVLSADTAWGQKVIIGGGVAQPIGPGGKDKKDDKSKDDRPPEDDNIPFTFPAERDLTNQLKAARDYLSFKTIPWNTVCPLLQNILEAKSDSFFNTYYIAANGKKELLRISVKTEANRIIAAFPKEGIEFYQQTYGGTASAQLDDAIKANYDIPLLAEISQRYLHTKAGGEATILLASLYLERGNYLEAAQAFERAFGRLGADDFMTPRTLFKAALAFKRSGDPRYAASLKVAIESLRKSTEKTGLILGRQTYPFEKLKAEIDRNLELLRITTTVGEWAMLGGNGQRSATIDGGPPFLDPTFRTTMFYTGDDEANTWIKTELEKLFVRDGKTTKAVPLPGFFPITTTDMVIFRTYSGVFGVATRDQVVGGKVIRAGDVRWVSRTTFGPHQMLTPGEHHGEVNLKQNIQEWWQTYSQAGVTSVLYENPLIGGLSHDGQNVYFIDDVAIPPPPVFNDPNMGFNQQPQYRQHGELADAVRAGRLAAVDLKTGGVKWDLGRVRVYVSDDPKIPPPPPLPPKLTEEEADKTTNAFQLCLDAIFLSAPLPLDGKLYVLIEQAGVIRLLCLDPRNLIAVPGRPNVRVPTLVWSQKLGRPANNLPQDSIRRYQGATLAAGEGIIICPTNSGAIVAVDAMSRSLLWAHAYKKNDPEARPRQPMFDMNGRMIPPVQLKPDRWRASSPIIANGRIILTAYDSDKLECLDLRTGKVLWTVPRTNDDLYVGGVVNDRVIVVGRNQVKGYHLIGEGDDLKPRVAFEPTILPSATPTGHGVGGRGVYYIPVRQDNAGRDSVPPAEVWAVNVETGQIVSKTGAHKRNDNAELAKFGIGNLVFQDGMVFAQSAWELACYPQLEQKKNEMNKLLAANPKDPIGLLARGELLLDDGKLKEAIADFKEAQKNNLPIEKQPLLREKLYTVYTELIRNDFAAGEVYLQEYEALCEVPIDDSVDPIDKQNRRDETERRRRLSLYLLARGREGQGRLGEAFDKYLALANLGEGKTLLDMPDEPNVRMRPDVWARGRIESMIRKATNAEARKSLEERVDKEWNVVKDGGDLKRLREFVSVFGPYFQSGAEAQFLLADKLLQTNNEVEAREAQTHLSQLRATADDATVRARATEALARLMVKSRMMEDAVGLYLQLGKEYANVPVRDGKTGADFMRSLITDKRLLPYLEPSRYPLPTRVKAELRLEQQTQNNNGAFEVEPGGELFPMFKRYRFVIEMYNPMGNGLWTLRAFDRSTGIEKAKFTNLAPPQIYNPGSFPFSKYVQGNGQVLLVQLGTWVYCLDLAEKKERWQKNLLGDVGPGGQPNQQVMPPGPDGEVTVKYAEGFYLTFGRAAVLQAGYCALLTRDGIEVVEPLTRRVLWTRRNLPERTHLYGDARHLVVVETDASKKPISVKLLRAVDGMVVEGSPDSGRVLATAKSFQLLGRTALLTEGTGEQPRVLRLYDLATGKDVWRKDYESKAIPIKGLTPEWTGFIRPNGVAEVIEVSTGRIVATLKIDEKNLETDLKPSHEAQLFADADRFYLILDREPGQPSTNGTHRVPIYNNTLRTHAVNGPIYAFDRATGKRLWNYGSGLFENQMLILEQFAELPVIIAAGPMQRQGQPQQTYQVVMLEKARGKLIFDRPVTHNGNFFHNLNVNLKNGTIDLIRFDLRILISPDDAPKP